MLIPDRIKEKRLEHGMTQQDLATLINVTKTSVCCYEKGKRTPNIETLEDIASVFNVTTDYLLGRDTNVIVNQTKMITFSNSDVVLIRELKRKPQIYNIVSKNPKRAVELLTKRITKTENN